MSESDESKSKGKKICDCCGESGAKKKCKCGEARYCNRKCQKKHWPIHREKCTSRKVKPNISVIKEEEHLCPICMDNEDNAYVNGSNHEMCFSCGQMFCGMCANDELSTRSPDCPICGAPFDVSDEDTFLCAWNLVNDMSPNRYTPDALRYIPSAHSKLGLMYYNGKGVEIDLGEAAKLYRLAADKGDASARNNLGMMYCKGEGVVTNYIEAIKLYHQASEQGISEAQFNLSRMYSKGYCVEKNYVVATKLLHLAAQQGNKGALINLDNMQQENIIPTPPPGTRIKLILLTSPKTSLYNNLVGKVVISEEPVKEGKVPILLDDSKYPKPLAFKLKFVQIIEE